MHRAFGNAPRKVQSLSPCHDCLIMVYRISNSSPLMPKAASAFPCHKSYQLPGSMYLHHVAMP